MKYTLKVESIFSTWHDHFVTLEQLFVKLGKLNKDYGYKDIVFSLTGDDKPDMNTIIVTIFDGYEVTDVRATYDDYRREHELS